MEPDDPADGSGERVPCVACGEPAPLPEEVHSPACYRPLCEDCGSGGRVREE